jgi:hypothetical protein
LHFAPPSGEIISLKEKVFNKKEMVFLKLIGKRAKNGKKIV